MHYHLPLYRSLPANGQETNWEPQPGSSITIACDNRCVILSSTLQPPRRCVITGDCHNLVPSHGEASDLNCSALNLENVSCQVLILYEHWGISVGLKQLSDAVNKEVSGDFYLDPNNKVEVFGGVE